MQFVKKSDMSVDLPIHYSLRIGEILKNNNNKELVEYISGTLGCVCFLIDTRKSLSLKGLSNISRHKEFVDIVAFLENPEVLNDYITGNFSLHPVLVKNRIRTGGKTIEDVVFLCVEGKNCLIGILGDLSVDFELAVGIMKFVKK